jgi:putative ABC transport system ATP-binding protein
MTPPEPILEMRAAAKHYESPHGAVPVLRHVDLTVRRGDFVMITGPSGSGKSTLLNLAALLDHPTGGRVRFEGRDVSSLSDGEMADIRKHRIGMVFQKFCLLPHRSVIDNVLFRFRYIEDAPDMRAKAMEILASMGLQGLERRRARFLSSGEMQRVAIARAVVLQPVLLLADEPTGNLDRHSTTTAMETFHALHTQGLTILMVTHNDALLRYATHHHVCEDGTLREQGMA